ncbi:GGDEF domain-containing protein [Pseudonocardia sp. GCM10023141]|uniref:GGDEF domain-containing protein n=1 Tax=Pseudonocardia sp. GCM10023141 TaxID=3252653 RepID=UPI003620FBBC
MPEGERASGVCASVHTRPDLALFVVIRTLSVLLAATTIDRTTHVLRRDAWPPQAAAALHGVRSHDSHAVLMLDIDNFKAVNDTYGHGPGDQVLSAVASTIRTTVRAGDVVGRWGGDEFVVLLSGRDSHAAYDVAERIRARLAERQIPIATPSGRVMLPGLTASIGVTSHRGGDTDVAALLAAADRAMYAAKQAGRNCVYVNDGRDSEQTAAIRSRRRRWRYSTVQAQFPRAVRPETHPVLPNGLGRPVAARSVTGHVDHC